MMYSDEDDWFYNVGGYMVDDDYDDDDSDDDDDYYEDGDYMYDSDHEECWGGFMITKPKDQPKPEKTEPKIFNPVKLVDQCCKFLALNFPFAYLQDRYPPVADELQLKVISLSFPSDEKKLMRYAALSSNNSVNVKSLQHWSFGEVTEMRQIGFRLSAKVEGQRGSDDKKYVTLHFDRGKITDAHCSCDSSTRWCNHVIATALTRIRSPEKLTSRQLHPPISDSLYQLNREQLLKFAHAMLQQHQNTTMVETAQDVLDKLLNRNGQYDKDEINTMKGVPDPTSGPGLDEECRWFICTKGFKDRCRTIHYESTEGLGFASKWKDNFDSNYDLQETWSANRHHPPIIKESIDNEIDSDAYSHSSHRRQEIHSVLETIYELLAESTSSAVVALKACTEEVVAKLARCPTRHEKPSQTPAMATASVAMGFTARPFRCGSLSDELSTLWQLAVLNPKLSQKQKKDLLLWLGIWHSAVSKGSCEEGNLMQWQGLRVASNMKNKVDWSQEELKLLLNGKLSSDVCISGAHLIEFHVKQVSIHIKQPFSMKFGSLHLEILTWCSIIQALQLYNYRKAAVSLAVVLSAALVNLFRKMVLEGYDISMKLPITKYCTISNEEDHDCYDDQFRDDEEDFGIHKGLWDYVEYVTLWPRDTILNVTTYAFLYDVLGQYSDLVEDVLSSYRKQITTDSVSEDSILNGIPSGKFLQYYIGVMGLFQPRVPLATRALEVEAFDTEKWLCAELMSSCDCDKEFLWQLAEYSLKNPIWHLGPPSSLLRVILYQSPQKLVLDVDKQMKPSPPLQLAIDAAIHCLKSSCSLEIKSTQWSVFQFANCRLWASLAELLINRLGELSAIEQVMDVVLSPSGCLGAGNLTDDASDDDNDGRCCKQLHKNIISSKGRISYALAKSLSRTSPAVNIRINNDRWSYTAQQARKELPAKTTLHVPPIPQPKGNPSGLLAVKRCAIRLGAHSLMLEKISDKSSTHGSVIRWLTEYAVKCGVEGVRCLITCYDDLSTFLNHDEALNLCTAILKMRTIDSQINPTVSPFLKMNEMMTEDHLYPQETDDPMLQSVKEVLVSVLHEAVKAKALDRIKDIYSTCRETRETSFHGLVPWLSQHIQRLATKEQLTPEIILFASHETFSCFTTKLTFAAIDFRRVDPFKDGLGLKRLFDEGADEPDDDQPAELPHPYQTQQPHPCLDLAFSLGIMGLELLSRTGATEEHRPKHWQEQNRKEHLRKMCELVCYIGQKKWLHDRQKLYYTGTQGSAADGKGPRVPSFMCKPDDSFESDFLMPYVTALVGAVTDPMLLFHYLREISMTFVPQKYWEATFAASDAEPHQIRAAVSLYPSLNHLLTRSQDAFSELLLGPKVKDLVAKVTRQLLKKESVKDMDAELLYAEIEKTTLREVLLAAKAASNIRDPTGRTFRVLANRIAANEPALESAVDSVVTGKEVPRPRDRECGIPFSFWPFIANAHDLALAYRHNPFEDMLYD